MRLWAGWAPTPEPSSLGLSSRGVCVRHGDPPVLPFHPALFHPWRPSACQWDPALSTMSSMSPESFVSGVVRVHLRARACAWGTRVLSCFRAVWAVEGWPVFTLSVFLLVFFLFPPHPHRTLPSTQTLISQISEKVGPFHFLSICSSPVDGMLPSVRPRGLGQLPQARPSQACPPVGLRSLLFGPAGRQDQGWAGWPPALHVCAAWVPDVPRAACPLSWAPLLGRSGRHGA